MAEPACPSAPLLMPESKKAEQGISSAMSDFLEGKINKLTDRRNSLLDIKNGELEVREASSTECQS